MVLLPQLFLPKPSHLEVVNLVKAVSAFSKVLASLDPDEFIQHVKVNRPFESSPCPKRCLV